MSQAAATPGPQKNTVATSSTTETLDAVPPHGMKQDMTPEPPVSAGFLFLLAGGILMTALCVAGGLSLWSWWRRRQHKTAAADWTTDPSDWQRLLEAIAAIKIPQTAMQHGDDAEVMQQRWNEFSSEISVCLRRALELKTGQPFGERTTEEIRQWVQQGLDLKGVMEDRECLAFLEAMDRVRFGGGILTEAEAQTTLERLRDWVRRLELGSDSTVIDSTASIGKLTTDAKGGLRVFDT